MADTTDTRLERLRAVAATSNLRSPLARWFSANHAEFEKLLKDYRPRWEALVEQFGADGTLKLPAEFTSADQTVREAARRRVVKAAMRTWERAKVQVAQKPAPLAETPLAQDRQPSLPVQPGLSGVRSAPPIEPPPRERRPMVLRPARPLGPTEQPEDDGSKLPKPLHRVR